MDAATRKRIARCLDYHDGGSPTHEDVQALWWAYTEVETERDQWKERWGIVQREFYRQQNRAHIQEPR